MVILNENDNPGKIVFNASVYKLGSERHYKINAHKSAHFVHHLLNIDAKNGEISLRRPVRCDGIHYPSLFTFYVDSTSNRLHSIDYYSLPLRIFIVGINCIDDAEAESFRKLFMEDDAGKNHRFKRRLTTNGLFEGGLVNTQHLKSSNITSYTTLQDGDVLFETIENNKHRSEIISRKKRSSPISSDERIHRKINEARQWISETFASYAIHTTDKWNQICLKKSQYINSVNSFLPKTVLKYCTVKYIDVNNGLFKIEPHSGDLVASGDVCISESWKLSITFSVKCDRMDVVDADHRLKVIYHHQNLNDTDIATRVKRELRNQSPYFEQALYVVSAQEEQPAGTEITTVRARDPEHSVVSYTMVSLLDSRSQSMFQINTISGTVKTVAILDREVMDVHYFRIIATDDSFPPRSGTSTLQVNVLDCNDHTPAFESEEFHANVREGTSVGSSVITIRATDQDIGKNGEIEYSIASVSGDNVTVGENADNLFRIEARTGTITTRGALDREISEMYVIQVMATDMAIPQSERKSTTATVFVNVLDDNDNYPQFSERTYTVHVSEDQWTNENNVIAQIRATDADKGNNAAVRYAIIGGNTQSQFSMDSISGDVLLVKPLDYESIRSYRLVIRAQDGGSPSRSNTTQLLVNVQDANDNAPRFYTTQFQEAVLESVPVGYNIVRVQAYDSDEGVNSEISYRIQDRDENSPLAIDSRTGWIHTTSPLDREEKSRYVFQVVAIDGGIPPKSASTSVVVTIQDINDNDPIFNPKYYEASIAEDQPPGTPVTTVTATDLDEDSRLHYEITSGNTRGRFSITSQNGRGLITIAQSLDYKQEQRFALTVSATDSGQRSDQAIVNINITDANNFAPVFENAPYTASVFEDAPVGTTVLMVFASDNDVGLNAQITYSLNEGSSNGLGSNEPFSVHVQTGAIVTTAALDRETTSTFLLTVTAKDSGNPSLADTTDVEISITDINDNSPQFDVPLYQATIAEDAFIGTSVLQISATDDDMGLNGRVKFMLSSKDVEDGSFVIDPSSGVIRTNKGLDRESIAVYHLIAIAADRGTPTLSSSVEVQIRLNDINDSPPTFASDKLTMYVPENSPVGSAIGEIYAHDPDEGVNAIVHYSIIGGDDLNAFSLVTRPGSERAQLLTMTELDFESNKKRFELVVRAASPPLRSDVLVEIFVTDVNDNAPTLRDFQIIFNNFKDCFPSGIIGRIPAFDADVTDRLNYRILSGNNANLVLLNSSTGGLTLSPQLNTNVPRFATMEVSVNDGINEAKAIMQLIVRLVTEDMLFNSITVRLNEMTEEAFMSPLLNFFMDGLAAIIPCPRENIYLFSIQDDTDVNSRILNVSFSARKSNLAAEEYYSPQYLQEKVYLNRAILARLATVQVLPFDDNLCVREPCLNYEKCLSVLKFGNASGFISSETVLFRPIHPVNTFACKCPEGFTGSKEHYLCDTEVDLCYSEPCQNGGSCVRNEGGYTCVCTALFTGVSCETEINSLKSCAAEVCGEGYSCLADKQTMSHSPLYTKTCELMARSFTRNSFLTFPSINKRHRLNIQLKFATMRDNGLLLYNGRYNDENDFIALEIINGRVTFSFSLGERIESVMVDQHKKVSDGNWHTVEVNYFNRTVQLSIDNCDTALAYSNLGQSWNCANRTTLVLERRCASLTESCHRFLDLTGPLQLGGLPKIATQFQIHSHDFIGCIKDVYLDHRYVDLNSYIADNGTIAGCPQKSASCSSEPCFNGGTCREGWGEGWQCECLDGFSGNACQETVALPWRFNGDGILSFNPLLRPIQLPWLTALTIRTRQKDAFLMQIQIGQNSSAVLSLRNGVLYYTYNSSPMFLTGTNLADGQSHRIEVKWLMSNEISLSVDYGQQTGVLPMTQKIQGLYVGRIMIGGTDGNLPNEDNDGYFKGCIHDVRIGNSQSILNRPTIRENVIDGCTSNARCPESCPEHSTCVKNWDQSYCECKQGYVGVNCAPVCTVHPCHENGRCRYDKMARKGYVCECNSTTSSGEYCEIIVEKPCPAGWWGERGCGPCKCNVKNGYHPVCNKNTGECFCQEHHYQLSKDSACLACECYAIGSYGKSCSSTGQCECREGVIGRRCDSCSNPYAEVTLNGCEVVYDACPKSFAAGLWWPRTSFNEVAIENCPSAARGKVTRKCDLENGGWGQPDVFNCTSEPFLNLRKQLSQIETKELEINTFVSVKIAATLEDACDRIGRVDEDHSKNEQNRYLYIFEGEQASNNIFWEANEFGFSYLSDERNKKQHSFYGSDLLITERLLHELLNYESNQSGLNLSHSQDKHYIKNLVTSAGMILDKRYKQEWKRLTELTQRNPNDLVEAFNRYLMILGKSQQDTYTDPFEIVQDNMVFGLDVVDEESHLQHETQLHVINRNSQKLDTQKTEHESRKQKLSMISFPKYNNYIQDKNKFDLYSKIIVPLENRSNNVRGHRAIVGYAQYKDAGDIYAANFDETIMRRWGVEVIIASPLISINILVPNNIKKTEEKPSFNDVSQYKENDNISDTLLNHDNEKISNDLKVSIHDLSGQQDLNIQGNGEKEENNNPFEDSSIPNTLSISSENINAYRLEGKTKRSVIQQYMDAGQYNTLIEYKPIGNPYLTHPIKLQMWLQVPRHKFGPRSNPQCVRWNSHMNFWTRLGCQTEVPPYEHFSWNQTILITCTCNQISSYAVLIDVTDPDDIAEPSMPVRITSYSAYVLSLTMLFSVILSLALLRGLQTNSNTIHQNLVFCIFIAELLFFAGTNARQTLIVNEFACKLVAIALHYAWLAAFAWTTVDCVHLYRMLTEMRDVNHGPMGFYYALGYGSPALLVGLSIGVRAHEYGNSVFCWLSVYESVIWWLVGPVVAMSVISLLILFMSVKAAFTIKDHVLEFGNLRTLLWLSVVSLPLMGILWVLSVLVASESSQMLQVLLSGSVIVHALFSVVGYCIINKRVRENLHRSFLICTGRKVPLLDSSMAISISSQNVGPTTKTPGFTGHYETARRNIGISASSTTSRSTTKTSSIPYRSDSQFRHTSTSTSNYNSNSDGGPTYVRGYESRGMRKSKVTGQDGTSHHQKDRHHKRDSDSGSETDGRSFELASSHSSDDEESRVGRNSSTHRSNERNSTFYLSNIMEHVATTPPELHVVQSPQLFPNVNDPRWSNRVPDSYINRPNVGRWSQETGSDNEMHPQNVTSTLPRPDLTDTSYLLQDRMGVQPSLLENIHESCNFSSQNFMHENNSHNIREYRDFEDIPQHITMPYIADAGTNNLPGSAQVVNHMRAYNYDTPYTMKDICYDPSKTNNSIPQSSYIGKERISSELYSPRIDNVGSFKSSVQSLLKNDYQRHKQHNETDRMSESSDKNPYNFPYTAEEDHSSHNYATRHEDTRRHQLNNPSSIQPEASLTIVNNDTDKRNDDEETTV